ncbi:predicted protein [Phaeodactylum tricornutum CCAP 1055/1]|uniref:DOT1 domain-containing protein n=1 Tax=Phaeodactylum tricornutum (strain CCAP 1055/1) TaxID=556484 RepID=B7FR69_PHATC|nr:predicted protein [Phaeodactylum tricornutum CCAP 1055/1]EEC51994.1 predicted protein [Phaeodactylum tricornutum CCAP 1055/1]|eukprot:XP_002177531.1 predicted protein [Phaeodactylum tricornutum CCAP 1055/1]
MAGKRAKLSPEPLKPAESKASTPVKGLPYSGNGNPRARESQKQRNVAEAERFDKHIVTPSATVRSTNKAESSGTNTPTPTSFRDAKRSLFPQDSPLIPAVPVTPSRRSPCRKQSAAKKKLMFGRLVTEITVAENVKQVYGIIRKLTGSIGGNGSHGPIYGELTMGSMQKMINLMKEYTNFSSSSRFIDVGSGIGKPNLHVAQDPGVDFSYGIEVEHDRWLLGYSCLKAVFEAAANQAPGLTDDEQIHGKCIFEHADIRLARSFDPFTHVYMFSIGFPPSLWVELSEMWNRSSSSFLICYHGPRDIVQNYDFDVELIVQTPTSMHGSKEGHMGYIYHRKNSTSSGKEPLCDRLFSNAWASVKRGSESLQREVNATLERKMRPKVSTRSRRESDGSRVVGSE